MPVKCWHSLKTRRPDRHVCSLHVAVADSFFLIVLHNQSHVSCIGKFSLRSFITWRRHLSDPSLRMLGNESVVRRGGPEQAVSGPTQDALDWFIEIVCRPQPGAADAYVATDTAACLPI